MTQLLRFKALIGKVELAGAGAIIIFGDVSFKALIGKVELLILYHLEIKNAREFYYFLQKVRRCLI